MTVENIFDREGGRGITYNLYKVLELQPPCTDEELTKAYKKMAVKYHPDKVTGCSEHFQAIKEAYDMLKDPLLRKYYDKYGDSGIKADVRGGSMASAFLDSSTWYGRFYLKTVTSPTSLIPYFLFLAFIGVLFVVFLNLIDRKLYYSGLKEIPWFIIFSLLWLVEIFFLTILGGLIYLYVLNFKFLMKFNEESEEMEKFTGSRKRFFSRIIVLTTLFTYVAGFLFIFLSIYCGILLALNLDNSGNLINGFDWIQIFNAEIVFLSIYAVFNIIFRSFLLFRHNNLSRLWAERCLIWCNDIYSSVYLPVFIYNFGKWLDSTDRNYLSLYFVFSWLYARIVLSVIKNVIVLRWKYKDHEEIEILKYKEDPSKHAEIKEKIKRNSTWIDVIIFISALLSCLVIGLVHSHFSNNWPHTWSFTLFPVQICVYSSILVCSCFFPCILTCLQIAIPPNSFDNFISREDNVTIIEIPSIYPFGFGLAPLQPRIKFRQE